MNDHVTIFIIIIIIDAIGEWYCNVLTLTNSCTTVVVNLSTVNVGALYGQLFLPPLFFSSQELSDIITVHSDK